MSGNMSRIDVCREEFAPSYVSTVLNETSTKGETAGKCRSQKAARFWKRRKLWNVENNQSSSEEKPSESAGVEAVTLTLYSANKKRQKVFLVAARKTKNKKQKTQKQNQVQNPSVEH